MSATDSSTPVAAWLHRRLKPTRALGAALVVKSGDRSSLAGSYGEHLPSRKDLHRAAAMVAESLPCQPCDGADGHRGPYIAARAIRIKGRPCLLALLFEISETEDAQTIAESLLRTCLQRHSDHQTSSASSPDAARSAQAQSEAAAFPQTQVEPPTQTAGPITTASASAADAASKGQVPSTGTNRAEILSSDNAAYEAPALPADRARAQRNALALSAAVLESTSLDEAAIRLCALINSQADAQRVAIALSVNGKLKLSGLSDSIDFDPQSATSQALLIALRETHELGRTIVCGDPENTAASPTGHRYYCDSSGAAMATSIPLLDGDTAVGAILLQTTEPLSEAQRIGLEQSCLLLAPQLRLKRLENLGLGSWLWLFGRRACAGLFGKRWLPAKLAAVVGLALIAFGSLWNTTFKITAHAAVQATERRAVVAAYPSFLVEVRNQPGDTVVEGDVLARLDSTDLEADRTKWIGERDKLQHEFRASLATRDRSNARVLNARRAQTEAELDHIDSQLARAEIKAPMAGVIVSGDLREKLGSPVERGQLMFEVASLERYELALMVDEIDIDWIEPGQTGEVRLQSLAERTFEFRIDTVTPVSEAFENSNTFRVLATLTDPSPDLRPGMAGVSHIAIDERPIGWTWTRRFRQWLSLRWWTVAGS